MVPSEPSTPATLHDEGSASQPSSRRESVSRPPQSSATNIDAEDEDVKIAIMALGAMKHLDGKSQAEGQNGGKGAAKTSTCELHDPHVTLDRRREKLLMHLLLTTASALSTASITSTAISSPTASTPGTEVTHTTFPSTSSPPQSGVATRDSSRSTSISSSNPATLADLPPDFQFPAIVHDENGNEMRVDWEDMADDDFLKRVSHLPIVRGTLKAYELGKQRSRVVKYGGDFVESSVKAISRPVVSRLGARLGERGVEQLDDFACRQLDRVSVRERKG